MYECNGLFDKLRFMKSSLSPKLEFGVNGELVLVSYSLFLRGSDTSPSKWCRGDLFLDRRILEEVYVYDIIVRSGFWRGMGISTSAQLMFLFMKEELDSVDIDQSLHYFIKKASQGLLPAVSRQNEYDELNGNSMILLIRKRIRFP